MYSLSLVGIALFEAAAKATTLGSDVLMLIIRAMHTYLCLVVYGSVKVGRAILELP